MKNTLRLVILIFLIACFQFANAQNVLKIKSRNSFHQPRTIKNESKIQFKTTSDSAFVKGVIQQITDSSLVIFLPEDENTMVREYKFRDITMLRKPTTLHSIARIVGAPLVIVGGIVFIGGTMSTISPRDGESNGPVSMGIGGGALILGILPYIIKSKTYDLNKEYTLETAH
jgi:hypothetical protein